MADEIRALIGDTFSKGNGFSWQTITRAQMTRLAPGTSICITSDQPHGRTHSFGVYRPPRRRDESPVQYYKRTRVVDDNFTRGYKGRYYCNPAHCSRSWKSREERDEHLGCAHAILS